MDRQHVESQRLVERYLRDELSTAEAQEFELFYLTDPTTQRELESGLMLAEGLAEDSAAVPAPSDYGTSWLLSVTGAAALVLLGVLIGHSLDLNGAVPGVVGVNQSLFVEGALRGGDDETLGKLCRDLPATINLRPPGSGPYLMILSHAGEVYHSLPEQSLATHSKTGELQLYLPAGVLIAGTNQFAVVDQASGKTVLSASFDVAAAC